MLPLVVTVESTTGQKRRFAFADSPVRIGRSPLAELQLEEAFVSRWQGTVRFNDREVTYCNVSSSNSTFVGDQEVAAHDDLVVGDAPLRLGSLTLRFSREPVPEADLRRKGKSRPVQNGNNVAAKTVSVKSLFLRPPGAPATSLAPQTRAVFSAPPLQAPLTDPAAKSPLGVILVRPVVVGSQAPATGSDHPEAHVPAMTADSSSLNKASRRTDSVPPYEDRPLSVAPKTRSSLSPPTEEDLDSSHPKQTTATTPKNGTLDLLAAHHREAWSQLFSALGTALEQAPAESRAAIADDLQRRYPQIVREPEFRDLLKNYGLEPRKIDIPEISGWLREIAEGVLPAKFHLDTGLTLQRVLALTEVLSQSFAEINDAQQSVRSRWLGRAHRTSVIKSDDGHVVLAYLLNPKGEWETRLAELEEAAREAVVHEFALFKATLGGARELLESISPETIAEAEGIDLEEVSHENNEAPGLWGRIISKKDPEQRLWRRFVSTYENLVEGDRFQRAFMGRAFARTYLAAMGNGEATQDK